MTNDDDRLYALLPTVVRERDAAQGFPLRALLRVIGAQAAALEADIGRLYDNWFIETCEDWVVPYLGDLVGHRMVHEAGLPAAGTTDRDRRRNRVLIPRRDVANTIRNRGRKGTRALLEQLAADVAGWPASAVESFDVLAWAQHVDHVRLGRGGTIDLHDGDALERIGGPFDRAAHTPDVRSRYNLPGVGLFVWRLRPYSVTGTPACCLDERPNCYTFSIVGHDTALFHAPHGGDTGAVREVTVPSPIRRRRFERHPTEAYGASFEIRLDDDPIALDRIVAADLDDWRYQPYRQQVAVDPERGRIAFAPGYAPLGQTVSVSYRYTFGGDIGGGEYERELSEPGACRIYRRTSDPNLRVINAAIGEWRKEQDDHVASGAPPDPSFKHAVIELCDSGLYEEPLNVVLKAGESLQIRAANAKRPVLAVTNLRRGAADAVTVRGGRGSRFTLDGILVVGGAVQVLGPDAYRRRDLTAGALAPPAADDLFEVRVRHCTLVPGWSLSCDYEPVQPAKPSLELRGTTARVVVERSILGSIEFVQDAVTHDPVDLRISDSIVDATDRERQAIDAPGYRVAHATLTIARTTVIGSVSVHVIELAENCVFDGAVLVGRRQRGCMRYSYVPPGSRTPRRHMCQPEAAVAAALERADYALQEAEQRGLGDGEKDAVGAREQSRVRPHFESRRYGAPTYGQLALSCPPEIARGADDEAEMGAFHDLFQPQRTANLTARLEEYTPAGMTATILVAT